MGKVKLHPWPVLSPSLIVHEEGQWAPIQIKLQNYIESGVYRIQCTRLTVKGSIVDRGYYSCLTVSSEREFCQSVLM